MHIKMHVEHAASLFSDIDDKAPMQQITEETTYVCTPRTPLWLVVAAIKM